MHAPPKLFLNQLPKNASKAKPSPSETEHGKKRLTADQIKIKKTKVALARRS